MSVRQAKYKNPVSGKWKTFWTVDIQFQHSDGHTERVRKVSPVQTRRGAEQYERELRQSLLDGTHGKKEVIVPTCAEFSEEFLRTYVKTNNKPSECQTKAGVFRNHLNPAFGKLKLDEIRGQEIERFKARKLGEGLSPKTVNNCLTILRRMLSLAHEWDIINGVPHVKWLKVPEPEIDFLNFEEAARLVKGAEPGWDVMILTGLRTGLRHGELIGLRWEDIDLVAGRLLVRQSIVRGVIGTPKSGKKREVPLSPELREALKGHRHLRGDYVFCNPDGSYITKGETKWPLWRAYRRAGLRRIGWHCLRHTFASHLVMKGVPLKAVQELMGHATIEMAIRYSHLSPDVKRDAVGELDSAPEEVMLLGSTVPSTRAKTG